MKAVIGLFFLEKPIPVAQLAFLLVAASLIASSLLGELEQFIKASSSKNGRKRKLDIEPKSDIDSNASSDSESVRYFLMT
jgi:hypothetical protein